MTSTAWLALLATYLAAAVPASAQSARPRLQTNQAFVERATASGTLAIADPLAVFAFVLNQLPDSVRIFPTENYYYVRFSHNGVAYTGNIRLAASDRDQGKVNFSYGEQPSDWNSEPADRHMVLDASHGVTVERVEPLVYRVAMAGKSVRFALNDLSAVKPPDGLLGPDEQFLGPVFDESALRFFLVFNARLKVFHYILDESAPVADRLVAMTTAADIVVGKRSGFAFYKDGNRKILIGVSARQSRLNTYFDGPFDQLPENFIDGEALLDAILIVTPEMKGQIDRLGNFSDGSGRYLIHPYLLYRELDDLLVFRRCVTSRQVAPANRALCFVISDDEARRRRPQPLALKRH